VTSTPVVSMPETAPEAVPSTPRPPLRELLPQEMWAVGVVAVGIVLVAASFIFFGASGRGLVGAVLCPVLVLLAVIDVQHRLLPNEIVFPAALVVGLIVAVSDPGSFVWHLAAGAALGGFFLAFAIFFQGSVGLGDAKVGFLIGLALAARTFSAMMAAFAGLLVAALWVLARRGMSARKDSIPFGPFLALGAILGFFLG
jgi:prepilin signal peptidase PulO-like enzyme (type II secretory pathway)